MAKEWKWSNGEENIKSPRMKPILTNTEESKDTLIQTTDGNVMTQCLEENSYDFFTFEPLFSRNDNESSKKMEDLDDKISNRELIFQRGTNPFLNSSNYIQDVVARDIFLKPKNTTFEKPKHIEEE